ncbi:MAG: hypothetical protein Q4E22_02430, partial [Coriobacteriia bacterium]|nr:hypothetical protein [Coriobacteriia bacterium]
MKYRLSQLFVIVLLSIFSISLFGCGSKSVESVDMAATQDTASRAELAMDVDTSTYEEAELAKMADAPLDSEVNIDPTQGRLLRKTY